jgi:hypothetical protein
MGVERVAGLAAVAVCAALVAGCDPGITDAIVVENETTSSLHFQIVAIDGRVFPLPREVAPGGTLRLLEGGQLSPGAGLVVDGCTVGDLVAYADDGQEVARHAPPVCAPSLWVIGMSDVRSPPPSSRAVIGFRHALD